MQMLVHIELLYFVEKNGLIFSIVLELNMFLQKSKHLLDITTSKPIFLDLNQIFQYCVDTFALDLLILCLQIKLWLILLVCFLLMILKKKWQYNFEIFQRWMKAILFKQLIINLADQKKFRLSEISKTENYFN